MTSTPLLSDAQRRWDADLWWILGLHQGDARSDFSAVHRLMWSEVLELDAAELGSLAYRLVDHPGSVQASALKAYRKSAPGSVTDRPAPTSADGVPVDPSPEQVKAMRDAARRRRFGPEYGEHKYVGLDQFMAEASRGGA